MNMIKNILISIAISYILITIETFFKSNFLVDFLEKNIITIIVALLAINLATLSIVLSKIREIIDSLNVKKEIFLKTKKEILASIQEQIALVFTSIILLIIIKSEWILTYPEFFNFFNIGLVACFTYSIIILYDTAKSIFIIIDFEN